MTIPDRLRPTPFIAGLAGGATTILVGVWLITAPFAVGYQPDGADWADATIIGVATGIAVIFLGLLTLLVVGGALRAELQRRGLSPSNRTESIDSDTDAEGDHRRSSKPADDLDTVLASLAAALLEDVRDGHHDPARASEPPPGSTTFPTARHQAM
jgi:hypothetical protein